MKSFGNKEDIAKIAVESEICQKKMQPCCQSGGFFFALKNLPRGVFAISLFGLFLGLSTTMVYSQLGLFLKNELGASASDVSSLDGIVEFLSFLMRIFSGPVSDFLRERKMILYVGCFITLFARSLLSFAGSWWMILFVQSSERLGNGIQATPRDALIADLSPSEFRGRAFGFSRSLKTVGSFLGTLIAIQIMLFTSGNYRIVFGCAVIPVIVAIFCLSNVKTHREISGLPQKKEKCENPFKKKYLKSLDKVFWKIILLALVCEMGHFSEHLFPIYANEFLSTNISGSVSMFVSMGQVALCFPIGILADKYGKGKLIAVCIVLMILANIFFISARFVSALPIANVYLGAFLWGGQMTASQGLYLSLICERVDFHLRATAMGIYSLMLGIAYLTASFICGSIWDKWGSSYAFLYSMSFSIFALSLLNILLPRKQKRQQAV
ncbi:MAG: MFS transporter [Holosporaceae bacterium]|jgi:MFS family permease|nr:MFS transporter [Holosporaceae bacterium]